LSKKLIVGILAGCLVLLGATAGHIQWTQLVSGDRHGTDAKGQSSDGTGTSGNLAKFDSSGGLTDGGVAASSATVTIANGTSALGTSAIASGSCASVVTTSATGAATTDNIMSDFNADPTGVTGYAASVNGMLTIIKYPTSNNVNFKVCNSSGNSITPGAITLNWRIVR
jgi:hypothetical protein